MAFDRDRDDAAAAEVLPSVGLVGIEDHLVDMRSALVCQPAVGQTDLDSPATLVVYRHLAFQDMLDLVCRNLVVFADDAVVVGVKEADDVVVVAAVVAVEVADVTVAVVVVVVEVKVADVVAAEVDQHCTAELTGAVAVMLAVDHLHSYSVETTVEVELHSFAVGLLMEEAYTDPELADRPAGDVVVFVVVAGIVADWRNIVPEGLVLAFQRTLVAFVVVVPLAVHLSSYYSFVQSSKEDTNNIMIISSHGQ